MSKTRDAVYVDENFKNTVWEEWKISAKPVSRDEKYPRWECDLASLVKPLANCLRSHLRQLGTDCVAIIAKQQRDTQLKFKDAYARRNQIRNFGQPHEDQAMLTFQACTVLAKIVFHLHPCSDAAARCEANRLLLNRLLPTCSLQECHNELISARRDRSVLHAVRQGLDTTQESGNIKLIDCVAAQNLIVAMGLDERTHIRSFGSFELSDSFGSRNRMRLSSCLDRPVPAISTFPAAARMAESRATFDEARRTICERSTTLTEVQE